MVNKKKKNNNNKNSSNSLVLGRWPQTKIANIQFGEFSKLYAPFKSSISNSLEGPQIVNHLNSNLDKIHK